jgi:hypothetical protein
MSDYRVYAVGLDDHFVDAPIILRRGNDQAAIEEAHAMVDGHDLELWDGARLVATIRSKELR